MQDGELTWNLLKFEGDEDEENKCMLLWTFDLLLMLWTSFLQELALENYELNCCCRCWLCECDSSVKCRRFSLIGDKLQGEACSNSDRALA